MSIPNGNVTFLFTDIEGSTKLAQLFPDTYQDILIKHNTILTEIIESHNGYIFKKVGDAFCSGFGDVTDAVYAAIETQKKLAEEFKDESILKVRMGINTGEAEFKNEDYTGYVTLSRVQRIMSVAHGGQILITQEVYDAIKDTVDSKIKFRDFGKRKLKDIILPEHIYQISDENIHSDFPPLKSLDARKNNLPVQLTSFIGREKEVTGLKKILSEVRLLNLIGFGGTGKTRLSVYISYSVLDEFANGVWFVELAHLSEPSHVVNEIVSVLKIGNDEKRKPSEVLIDFLREKELLLILDNCEHLIGECAIIAESLLKHCPKLKIIVTSREPLNISGESVYQVSTLSFPDRNQSNSQELSQFESVRLFIDRAVAVKQDFQITNSNAPALAELSYQLEGIPLAIELAAARIKVMSVEKILERLSNRFSLLTGGQRTLLPRQQTLKALIDWSYDLLTEKEKLLCRRLSVFSGGWTLEAAESVCSDEFLEEEEILDLLAHLTDKSLVKVFELNDTIRYTMLETIRKYGDERLIESKEKNLLQRSHYNFFFTLAKDSENKLTGTGQKEWIAKIAIENENIRDSLRWSLENDPDSALRMSVVLGKFRELRSHFTEGLENLRKSLESAKSVDPIWKAKAIYWTGFFHMNQGKYEETKKYFGQSLEMFRELKDKEGEALTFLSLGTLGVFENDYEDLESSSNKSLEISIEINNKSFIARNLQNIGLGLMMRGEHDAARVKFEEGLSLYRELNDHIQLAKIIGNIGALEYLLSNYDKATSAFKESLNIRNELGDRQGMSIALNNLGSVAYMQKDFEESERLLIASLEITRELGDRRVYVTSINTLGSISNDTDDFPKAIKMYTEAIVISNEIGDKYSIAKGIEGFATIFVKLEKFREACLMSAKYIKLLKSSNKNIIEGELTRIEDIKNTLKMNLNETDFERYWTEGENMSIEEALAIVNNE